MEFDRSSQDSFFAFLGQYKLLSFVGICFALFIFFFLVRTMFKTRVQLNEEQELLLLVQEWGAHHHLNKSASETPLEYF